MSLVQPSADFDAEQDAHRSAGEAAHLRDIILRMSREASSLGIDLVDIAGTIQDMAAMSHRHAATFDTRHQGGSHHADTNNSIADSLRQTDETAGRARQMLTNPPRG